MDITWLLVLITLIVLFAGISAIGALRRIRDATEKTLAILEAQATARNDEKSTH